MNIYIYIYVPSHLYKHTHTPTATAVTGRNVASIYFVDTLIYMYDICVLYLYMNVYIYTHIHVYTFIATPTATADNARTTASNYVEYNSTYGTKKCTRRIQIHIQYIKMYIFIHTPLCTHHSFQLF